MKKIYTGILLLLLILGWTSCKEKDDPKPQSQQKLTFSFVHRLNGSPIEFDTMKYVNEAGNPYLVNEIQYFISDVKLHRTDGSHYLIDQWKDMHYVDTDIPETHRWEVFDNIPAGDYEKISFTFGISEEKNHSFMFLNPPERDMFWPEFLGGGYHYMKLNGKWQEPDNSITPFDFHLGIGQIYYSYPDSITGYIHNAFELELPASYFSLAENDSREFNIVMHVENWFRTPNVYDHNVWGGYIMQNQEAMALACENAQDVFTLEVLE